MKMKFYVYVLKSLKDQSFYVGLTTDLKKRFEEHVKGEGGFTKAHIPYVLVFYSFFPDKHIAARFEKYLKTASGKAFLNKRLVN